MIFLTKEENAFFLILSAYESCEGDMEYLGHSVDHIIHKYLKEREEEK